MHESQQLPTTLVPNKKIILGVQTVTEMTSNEERSAEVQCVLARLARAKEQQRKAEAAARANAPSPTVVPEDPPPSSTSSTPSTLSTRPTRPTSPVPNGSLGPFGRSARTKRSAPTTPAAHNELVPVAESCAAPLALPDGALTASQLARMTEQRAAAEERLENKRRREHAARVMARAPSTRAAPGRTARRTRFCRWRPHCLQ